MEGNKYITVRITKKQYEVYKQLSYHKGELLKHFEEVYKDKKDEIKKFLESQEMIIKSPVSITGEKKTIIAPKSIDRKTLKAFAGFIAFALAEAKGNSEEAVNIIKRKLNW